MNALNLSRKTVIGIVLLVFAIVTTLVYSNHFHNSFHFDDSHTIVNNLAIRDISNIPTFFKDGTTFSTLPSNQSYRPVVTTLNALDYYFGGTIEPNPFPYHVTIFVSFILLGLFFFFVLYKSLETTLPSSWNAVVALFCTAWLWLHTANAETVNYIIARSDSFSTMLVMMSFACYLGMPKMRAYYLYMIPTIIGFFTKEPGILFLPLLFLYKYFFEADGNIKINKDNLTKTISVLKQLVIPIVVALTAVVFYKSKTPDTWTPGGSSALHYIMTQPYVVFHYFKNFFLPTALVVDTDWQPVESLTHPRVFVGIVFIIALLVIAYLMSFNAKNRLITFGILWFFITLAPTSLIPFAEVLNDHRTFFPYIGLFIATACLIRNLFQERMATITPTIKISLTIVAAIVLTMHAYGTTQRNKVWRTEESLWKEATHKAPKNGRAWMNYGLSQMAIGNYTEAEACYNKTLELWPNYSVLFINIGILKAATGKESEAEENFKKALTLAPTNPNSYSYYAKFLLDLNRASEAKVLIEQGLALTQSHPFLNQLAARLQTTQQSEHDLHAVSKPKFAPNTPEAYIELSLEKYNQGLYLECVAAAQQALRLKPDYDLAYNNICAAYNMLKEWDKAIEAGEKGLEINPNNTRLRGNLQVAYQEKGKVTK
jgi:Flp pilus assembly protein TadD